MIGKSVSICLAGLVGMALAGCVSTGAAWKKDGATADDFAVDKAACRSYARREAKRNFDSRAGATASGGVNNDAAYNALMSRHDARRDSREIFERCLIRRGYRKAAPKAAGTRAQGFRSRSG